MQKVFCFKSLFLFQLYSPLDISPSIFEKKKKRKENLKTRLTHLKLVVTTQSTFLKIFRRGSRFSQFDSKIVDNSVFEVLMIVFS